MFRLNEKVRYRTFRPGAESPVGNAFRKVFTNYSNILGEQGRKRYLPDINVESSVANMITEYHGSGKSFQV